MRAGLTRADQLAGFGPSGGVAESWTKGVPPQSGTSQPEDGIGPNHMRTTRSMSGRELVRVLLVEDDQAIAVPLERALTTEGFEVQSVGSGEAALAAGPVDVVILDVTLPDLSGFEVCRRLRARELADGGAVGIVMLTARSEEVDRVLGLELGADDYILKPCSVRELIARLRAVARRSGASGPVVEQRPIQAIGTLSIDRDGHRVHQGDSLVELTAKEFELLAFLAETPGKVLTRQHLLLELWDPHWHGPTKTVDVHVASLRRKLGDPAWIESIRGVGFRFQEPTNTEPHAEQDSQTSGRDRPPPDHVT